MLTAARTEKVQMGALADAAAALGMAVGAGNLNATQAIGVDIYRNFSGERQGLGLQRAGVPQLQRGMYIFSGTLAGR